MSQNNLLREQDVAEKDSLRMKFDGWYASPRGEAQFQLGMHYLGWAYICYAEGYKQAAQDMARERNNELPVPQRQVNP